jgi:hypothetical protein
VEIDALKYLEALTRLKTECVVQNGPFAGMKYGDRSYGSQYIPKLLGTYERELWPIIDEILQKQPRRIINIGAGEGYYAVGLALRLMLPVSVYAFELDHEARGALRQTAVLNNVSVNNVSVNKQIQAFGRCTPSVLQIFLEGYPSCPTIICDCEGDEGLILDLDKVPALRDASILVETHEFVVAGITVTLIERFRNTHDIRMICAKPRPGSEYPYRDQITDQFPADCFALAMAERPAGMSWLWMTPRETIA